MKKEIYLKKSTRDAIKKNIVDSELGYSFKEKDLDLVKKMLKSFPYNYDDVVEISKPNKYGICNLWIDMTGFGSSEEKEARDFIAKLDKVIDKSSTKDSIKDADWDFMRKLKSYDYDTIEKAMLAVFPEKWLKPRFANMWGDFEFRIADIANKLDYSKKDKLLKYLESNTKYDSIDDETWIDTPELLEDEDFYDKNFRPYWVEQFEILQKVKGKKAKEVAEECLDYIDDFKNENVKEEVKSDLEKIINE